MGRILAIDVGAKRCGIAVTDPLKLSVNPLEVVATKDLMQFLIRYCQSHEVETIVLGKSINYDGTKNDIMHTIEKYRVEIKRKMPRVRIEYQDEYNSSKEAAALLVKLGIPKNRRQKKENLDILSASIILQRFLGNY